MIGHTFQPDQTDPLRKELNNRTGALGPLASQALKIISLRLPEVLSGSPISVGELLRPRVGGIHPQSAVLGSQGLAGGTPVPRGGSETSRLTDLATSALGGAPPPVVRPGVDTPPAGSPQLPTPVPGVGGSPIGGANPASILDRVRRGIGTGFTPLMQDFDR